MAASAPPQAKIRCVGEQALTALMGWRRLRKLRCGTHRITDAPAAHVRLGGSVGNARRPSRSAGAVGAFMSTDQEPGEEALRRVSVRWMSM